MWVNLMNFQFCKYDSGPRLKVSGSQLFQIPMLMLFTPSTRLLIFIDTLLSCRAQLASAHNFVTFSISSHDLSFSTSILDIKCGAQNGGKPRPLRAVCHHRTATPKSFMYYSFNFNKQYGFLQESTFQIVILIMGE
jgi:hypothetical protein